MLSGIRIFSDDKCWNQILGDFNATLVSNPSVADVKLADLKLNLPVSPVELKAAIIAAMDNTKILNAVFGRPVRLSEVQTQIVVRLYKNGAMTSDELKVAIGYAPNANTHAVETAIYGLRKLFGHEFIKNNNGVFSLGGV